MTTLETRFKANIKLTDNQIVDLYYSTRNTIIKRVIETKYKYIIG